MPSRPLGKLNGGGWDRPSTISVLKRKNDVSTTFT